MKITMKEPDGPYSCGVDTGVMEVVIHGAFVGPTFITESGETLVVMMRDNGFELVVSGKPSDNILKVRWDDAHI